MKSNYEWRGKQYEIECEALSEETYQLRWDEETLDCTVHPLAAGGWLIRRGDQTKKALVHVDGDRRQIWFGGRTYTLHRIERQREAHSLLGQGEGSLRAEMPCQIVSILVTAGQIVEKGETLIQMEAMKMDLKLTAPSRGSIREWLVEEGQVVQRGQELLRFDALEST